MKSIIQPTILKGTRDFFPKDMAKRNRVMQIIRTVFECFGYDTIETPILNPAQTILGKYGEEGERLTYNFTRGDTRIALPYDLTVPFARFVATNFRELPMPFKRYQIQRVWRAEKPQKGRLREFYQCDIDIIGTRSLIAEAEIARIITDVFDALGFKRFNIEINSRRLMNDILKRFGVIEKNSEIIREIDKLAKTGEAEVIRELEKYGLTASKGQELLKLLKPEANNEITIKKLTDFDTSEIEEFLQRCKEVGVNVSLITFNPTLARGLDYYTGITYEVTSPDVALGSLCGGGRYDNLCGLFCNENFSGVGVAFGFERIMLALEELNQLNDTQPNSQVLVTLFNKDSIPDALNIYNTLVTSQIRSELYFEPSKLEKQLKFAAKKEIPFVLVRGPEEAEKNEITIKIMKTGKQKTIPLNQLTTYLKNYA